MTLVKFCEKQEYLMHSKYLTKEEILHKLKRYCTYQDRCHHEVRAKLTHMEVFGSLPEEIMAELIKENFLNEERFAKSFARGKFNIKNWGKVKISNELLKRNISDYCINKGLQEIYEEDYLNTLKSLIFKRYKKNMKLAPMLQKHNCYLYCIRKGFEVDLVLKYLPE